MLTGGRFITEAGMGIGWNDAALAAAGLIGSGVAVMHGVLVQRLMVTPIEALSTGATGCPAPS